MKSFWILLLMISLSTSLIAQDGTDTTSNWEKKANVGANFSTVQLENWAGGGQETVALNGLFNITANYDADKQFWHNNLDMGYGETKQGDLSFRKSDDRIILISKYGRNFTKKLSFSGLLDFRTQFTEGLDFKDLDDNDDPKYISNFMAPGYLVIGLGVSYKPQNYLTITVSPISNRIVFVLDEELSDQGAYGVEEGEKFLSELGSQFSVNFKKDIFKNVNLQSRLNMFAPYEAFTTMVVNWENLLTMKVNSWLNTSIGYEVFYDEKINIYRADGSDGPATQSRFVLAIGIAYSFDY